MNHNIACIIVTFNRKELLKRCLHAVNSQTYKPAAVYILDNASTDGTMDSVKEWGYYECQNNDIQYKYIYNSQNEGGAGGFYLGMKTAFEDNQYDALWIMDDDGEPDKDCLKNLELHLVEYHYIAPIVLSDEDRTTCSFIPNTTYEDFCKRADYRGIVEKWASPFNGILYSAKLIKTIGYPKKEMFIWGDEINYQIRAEKATFYSITVVNAIHYHPIDRQTYETVPGHRNVIITQTNWKLYCLIRNRIYNWRLERGWLRCFSQTYKMVSAYWHYYNKMQHDRSKNKLLFDAVWSGLAGQFGGMKKYWES